MSVSSVGHAKIPAVALAVRDSCQCTTAVARPSPLTAAALTTSDRRTNESAPLRPEVWTLANGKPFMGVCLGLQLLFDGSEESGGVEGLGVIPGTVRRFVGDDLVVPHIGWNTLELKKTSGLLADVPAGDRLYFVHSYRATPAGPHCTLSLMLTHTFPRHHDNTIARFTSGGVGGTFA